jgi:hypothetical protein
MIRATPHRRGTGAKGGGNEQVVSRGTGHRQAAADGWLNLAAIPPLAPGARVSFP